MVAVDNIKLSVIELFFSSGIGSPQVEGGLSGVNEQIGIFFGGE
jgi:hypothetical protein